jgi:DNA-binding GntR family transcriptional regulator
VNEARATLSGGYNIKAAEVLEALNRLTNQELITGEFNRMLVLIALSLEEGNTYSELATTMLERIAPERA